MYHRVLEGYAGQLGRFHRKVHLGFPAERCLELVADVGPPRLTPKRACKGGDELLLTIVVKPALGRSMDGIQSFTSQQTGGGFGRLVDEVEGQRAGSVG